MDQAIAQVFTKTRRMSPRDAHVFVQVKHFHVMPVDFRQTRQYFKKLKLRCARGGDDARPAALGDGISDDSSRTVGGSCGKRLLIRKDFYVHTTSSRWKIIRKLKKR